MVDSSNAKRDGRSVIVTGAASGMGQSTALLLGAAGYKVTVSDVDQAGCAETARLIIERGGTAQAVGADLRSEDDIAKMVDRAMTAYGALHAACNIAGVPALATPLAQIPLNQWQDRISVNLTAPFLCLKHQLPAIERSGGGAVVVVASTAAAVGFSHAAEYCAAKAGVVGLVRSAAVEYAPLGVRVNALLPGAIETPMLEAAQRNMGIRDYLLAGTPIGRFGKPEEIGHAIRWLISDEAGFVTGSAMVVDGGSTAI